MPSYWPFDEYFAHVVYNMIYVNNGTANSSTAVLLVWHPPYPSSIYFKPFTCRSRKLSILIPNVFTTTPPITVKKSNSATPSSFFIFIIKHPDYVLLHHTSLSKLPGKTSRNIAVPWGLFSATFTKYTLCPILSQTRFAEIISIGLISYKP